MKDPYEVSACYDVLREQQVLLLPRFIRSPQNDGTVHLPAVSVNNPDVTTLLKAEEVWLDLCVAMVVGPHIQDCQCGLVDQRNGISVHS